MKGGNYIKNKRGLWGYKFILLLVAFAWGSSYSASKEALDILPPFSLLFMRFFPPTAVLALLFAKRLAGIQRVDMRRGALIGLFMFGGFAFLLTGLVYLPASKQSFIVSSYVLLVPFLSMAVNRTSISKAERIAVVFTFLGLFIMSFDVRTGFQIGDLLSVLSAFCYAAHVVSIERFSHDSDPIVLSLVQFSVVSILSLAVSLVFERKGLCFANMIEVHRPLLYLSLVSTLFAFVAQNIVQKKVSSTETALILTTELLFAPLVAVIYLGEALSLRVMLGGTLILLSVLVSQVQKTMRLQ